MVIARRGAFVQRETNKELRKWRRLSILIHRQKKHRLNLPAS
jgi:hypothetical protein